MIQYGLKEYPTISMVKESAYFISLKFKDLSPFDCWIMAEKSFKNNTMVNQNSHNFLNTNKTS
jgi:hypothetical protein